MYAMLALFERGRKARIVNGVLSAPSEEVALVRIGAEFGDRLEPLTTPDERQQIYRWMFDIARRAVREPPRIQRDDILGGIAVACIITLATLPILAPFLLISDRTIAVRLSNLTALTLLFWLGSWWGRVAGANPLRIGAGVTCVGLILVVITIVLGG